MSANKQAGDNGALVNTTGADNPPTNNRGRPKGSPNKITADIRGMIIKALKLKGGVRYLVKQADDNPIAFMGLIGKILPKEITGPEGGPIMVAAIDATQLSESALRELLSARRAAVDADTPAD